jgi:hypothetical protein
MFTAVWIIAGKEHHGVVVGFLAGKPVLAVIVSKGKDIITRPIADIHFCHWSD